VGYIKIINIDEEQLTKVIEGPLFPGHGTVNGQDNLVVEENEKLFEQRYSIISIICQ